jgi:TrmH family RNA methyltransferase
MFPIPKLGRLPRSQKLRKAEKILAEAERRIVAAIGMAPPLTATLPPVQLAYLGELLTLLAADGESPEGGFSEGGFSEGDFSEGDFSPAQRQVLEEGAAVLAATLAPGGRPPEDARRVINNARQVLLAATGRYPADWDFIDADGKLDSARRQPFPGMQVYLEDIRSPFNVGAMFRVCESFGVEKLRLSPFCADPRHPRALRTSMGCVDILPWERSDLESLTGPFFALETGGIDIADFVFPKTGTLIVGSEELGVSPAALAKADASLGRVSITTYGAKGSLNVSVAFGIAMQRWAGALL